MSDNFVTPDTTVSSSSNPLADYYRAEADFWKNVAKTWEEIAAARRDALIALEELNASVSRGS